MAATLYRRARLATMADPAGGLGLVEGGAVLVRDGRVVFAGPAADLRADQAAGSEEVDCAGRLVTPGLIDCHTHLVHGGERSNEFEMRLAGRSYEDIARAGGGIMSTVRATRAASDDDLFAAALARLDRLVAEGVTTVEVKSGYGLDLATERRMLRVARRLGTARDVGVETSFLAAHALPPEWKHDRDGYVRLIAEEMLPTFRAEGLVDAVDGFCEGIAFSPVEIDRVFHAAHALGLRVKLHADQLSDLGGAALAAHYLALSADHLEHCSMEGIRALAEAGTVAVLLPGACYFLREARRPPVAGFRQWLVPMAIATDYNPGTSPLCSLLMAANMAATLFGLTVEECVAGITREAARALGLEDETGTLEAGKWADLAIWDVERPAELVCRMGYNPLHRRVRRGVPS